MSFDPKRYHRRSIRIPGFDYSQPGAYFITIVTQGRARLFGRIVNGAMELGPAGLMVQLWWSRLPAKFPATSGDSFVIMPNHVHGIIVLKPETSARIVPQIGLPRGARPRPQVSEMVQWFKTMTTNDYIRGVEQSGWPPFSGRVWQRNYFEHVVRDEAEHARLHDYILANPQRWADDRERGEDRP